MGPACAFGRSLVIVAGVLSLGPPAAFSENVDPAGNGSRFAYGENVGWIDAEPGGDGGPGMQVYDFYVTGWLWGENVGWISLSCLNTGVCDPGYVVRNDGRGVLSGQAWSENAGWIDFAPAGGGVLIDPATGDFSGQAWGENIGWITFASSGVSPYKVQTAWTCEPPPPVPAGATGLSVNKDPQDPSEGWLLLSWTEVPGATGYDVVAGRLDDLRASLGDFSVSIDGCWADNFPITGDGYFADGSPNLFMLVRAVNCGGAGSYDGGAGSQIDSRDPEIVASTATCP